MTRKLILLDLALAALLGFLAWQMRLEWIEAHARANALLSAKIRPVPANPLTPLPKVVPLAAISYADVAQMNLFSKDRNPQVIVDVVQPKPKPIPPFPVARGVLLWEGTPATVLLSVRANSPQKGYRAGDVVGEWKIVSVDNQYVVLEWDGKEFKKRLDELMDKSPLVAEASRPSTTPTPAAPVNTLGKSLGSDPSSPKGPGVDVGSSDLRMCDASDDSPAGTVKDGFKKVITQTPFGKSCRWEQVK